MNKLIALKKSAETILQTELAVMAVHPEVMLKLIAIVEVARATLDRQTDPQARWAMEDIAKALAEAGV